MIAFLSLLFVLIVIFMYYGNASDAKKPLSKEGFTPPAHTVQLPAVPSASSLLPDSPEPHTLPGQLPVAPYEQLATMSPLPYQDTTLIKANRQQLVSMLEMLKGFLAFEAQELSERSDPSIQLPLSNARADFQTLQNAVNLLNRNPGMQPTTTLTQLNEISANVAYLQGQVRLSGSAGTLQGPVYEFTEPATRTEGFQGQVASVEDLTAFVSRIQGEILRLSASGTTDPIIASRITALTTMKADVQKIIDQVQSGSMKAMEIPIAKSDIDKAYPILGKPNEPLPQLLHALKLPAGLANALPSNVQKDPDTMREISTLVNKYADQIVNGITASFNVTYAPSASAPSQVDKTGFPNASDLNHASQASFLPAGGARPITDRLAALPMDAGRGPSHFDWKQRAKEIESQVKKQGIQPADVGMMHPNTKTSDDFSWKGYTRMMCTRLQAMMDPSIGVTCGCPPMDWKGWR